MVTINQQLPPSRLETAEQLYCQLAAIPVISAGRFTSKTTIQLDYSIRDHNRLTKLRAHQSFHLTDQQTKNSDGPLEFIDSEINYQSYSPTRSKYAIFRTVTGNTAKQFWIEIWDTHAHRQLVSHNLSSIHQSFVLNDTFGFPTWNQSETQLAYLAETKKDEDDHHSWVERNRYVPDFGEQLTGIYRPGIFLISTEDHSQNSPRTTIVELSTSGTDLTKLVYGQLVFLNGPNDHEVQIICTGFGSLSDDRRLGLIYCQNRPSGIYLLSFKIPVIVDEEEKRAQSNTVKAHHPIDFKSHLISEPDRSARSPRLISDDHEEEKKIVYLSNKIGGPHASCATLHLHNLKTNTTEIVIGPVDEPTPENPFPGLYIDDLPAQPLLFNPSDTQRKNPFLVTSSIWGSVKKIVIIDLKNGHIRTVLPSSSSTESSCTLLNSNNHNQILCVVSQTNSSPQVWIGTLIQDLDFDQECSSKLAWQVVTHLKASSEVHSKLSGLRSQIIRLPENELGPTEVVLTSLSTSDTQNATKNSLIIVPHGGPHSTSVNEFSPSTAALALLGHSIAYINYPGSLGFGQKWVEELPKRLSIIDVDSCKKSIDYILESNYIKAEDLKKKDNQRARIFVNGGSHGGFITAHLTARYPDLFLAACMRNPVVDLVGTASGGSDIPDWSYAEANINFPLLQSSQESREKIEETGKVSVNEIDYQILRDKSPIKFIQNVKTPTLILLGNQDRRVSNQQGLAWYHGLKSLSHPKIETELILFENNSHPLSSIYAELNSFMSWFEFLDDRC
ncbi:hypothetical protein PSHT_02166 [Puccinia striiformis]|uniref:acylaminoacyl-peptidase n=1 Tax=Puccinia striiformis TaxID=27350 RepID=A0A2S4WIV0_9BASI|nr:hypothetical protein PSHT_02166 [Puccinia striiformis]